MSLTLTAAEERSLRAYLEHGSTRKAAFEAGISESTLKRDLFRARRRVGVENNAQLAYWLATGSRYGA